MKYIKTLAVACVALFMASCDEELSSTSVIPDDSFGVSDTTSANVSDFDKWLERHFTAPFNIRLQYKYIDKEAPQNYNVIPAKEENAKAYAIMLNYAWLGAYCEAIDSTFLQLYAPRIIQMFGSYKYNNNGSITLGEAGSGLKIFLYGTNWVSIDAPVVDFDHPNAKNYYPLPLRETFHVMHHEFCHILTQKKEYSTDYRTISAADYHSSDWVNVDDKDAPKEGFVTGYASMEYNEDFAEVYSTYITTSEAGWQSILNNGDAKGVETINKKLAIVREYFQNQWGLDIDEMRAIVIRRANEAKQMDLRTLPD